MAEEIKPAVPEQDEDDDLEIVFVKNKARIEVDFSKLTMRDTLALSRAAAALESAEDKDAAQDAYLELMSQVVKRLTGVEGMDMPVATFTRLSEAIKDHMDGANRGNSSTGS